MANNPLTQNLPADLPTNWVNAQIVPANGASVGLSTQHGYNYLMQQGNASQNAINTIGAAFSGVFGKNETIPIANGGTGATTATNARTNLSVYSKSEVNNLLSPMNSSITSLGSTKLNTIGKGVNLLDNWYFVGGGSQQGGGQFPINQRGGTSYTGWAFGIDRWKCGTTTTLRSDCVRIEGDDMGSLWFCQEPIRTPKEFVGLTLTASCLAKANTAGNLRMMFSDHETPGAWGDSGYTDEAFQQGETKLLTFTRTVTRGCACFVTQPITPYASFDVYAVKLELGDTQTLARQENGQWVLNDPPPNYALELAKCNMSLASLDDSYTNFPFLHIASGSYVGTGTYGASTPNSLSFSFAPKIIWCSSNMNRFSSSSYITVLYTPLITTTDTQYGGFCEEARNSCYGRKSSDGKTFYWYTTNTSYGGSAQNNASGTTYYYTAIG